jgi:uncharacterized protein YpmS
MKFSLGCLTGLFLGIVLAVTALAGYAFLNSSNSPPFSTNASATNTDLTVTITENYLSDQLGEVLAARGLKASDLSVTLHAPNRADVTMTTTLTFLGQALQVRPRASFRIRITNGNLALDLDQVNLGGLAIPQEIVNQQMDPFKRYVDQLDAELNRSLAASGLHVVGVQATEGALTVQLSR